MNWLVEEPYTIALIGGISAAIVVAGGLVSRRRELVLVAAVLLFGTGILLVIERLVVTDSERVRDTLYQIAYEVEHNNVDAALKFASSRAPEVVRQASSELPRYTFRDVTIKSNLTISVDRTASPRQAVARFNVVVSGVGKRSDIGPFHAARFVEVTFVEEDDGQWRVVAYQHSDPLRGLKMLTP